MMDHLTLEDCSSIVVSAREAKYEDTIMLTANEHAAYIRVRSGQLLLEQEKIPIRMPWHDSFLQPRSAPNAIETSFRAETLLRFPVA